VEVYAGVREEECAALLRDFFATHRVPAAEHRSPA
jgi:tRNA(adenine34) deaminase